MIQHEKLKIYQTKDLFQFCKAKKTDIIKEILKYKYLQEMQHQDLSTKAKNGTQRTQQSTYLTSITNSIKLENKFRTELTSNVQSPIFSTEYLTEDMFVGLGCSDGAIRIMSSSKGNVQYVLRNIDHSPVSSLALNPNSTHIKNALMATHVDGTLEYWHATSQQLLFSKKYEQFLLCCEISTDGQHYVFAGDKGHLKFGALSKGTPSDLQTGYMGAHSNRVFCLKWNPYDHNVFFSGGWDKSVFVWDIRTKTAVSNIFGIYMGGNAIDINSNQQLLLGNNTNEMPLRIYDMKASKARLLDWKPINQEQTHLTTGVLSCFFGYDILFQTLRQKDEEVIAVSPNRDVRMFLNSVCVSRYQNEDKDKKIFSLSKCQSSRSFAIGWSNGDVEILGY